MFWQQSNDVASAKQHNNKRNGLEWRCQRAVKDYYYYIFCVLGYVERTTDEKKTQQAARTGKQLIYME